MQNELDPENEIFFHDFEIVEHHQLVQLFNLFNDYVIRFANTNLTDDVTDKGDQLTFDMLNDDLCEV